MSRNMVFADFARRFAANFSTWNYLFVQVFLWFISYLFLAILARLVIFTFSPFQYVYLDWRGELTIAAFLGICTSYRAQIYKQGKRRLAYGRFLAQQKEILFIFCQRISQGWY